MTRATTQYLNRSFWTNTRKPSGLTPMDEDDVIGVALHWPGTDRPIGDDYEGIVRRLEGYREYHVNVKKYTDIAYQVAVDQAGRVWDLRGFEHRSAANGNGSVNRRYGAILVMVGPGEQLTGECMLALQDVYRERWLLRYPGADVIVEHGDIRPEPTDCPGEAVTAFIDSGYMKGFPPRPPTPENGSMMVLYVVDTPGDEKGETAYQLIGNGRRAVSFPEVTTMRRQGIIVAFVTVAPSDPIAKLPILR